MLATLLISCGCGPIGAKGGEHRIVSGKNDSDTTIVKNNTYQYYSTPSIDSPDDSLITFTHNFYVGTKKDGGKHDFIIWSNGDEIEQIVHSPECTCFKQRDKDLAVRVEQLSNVVKSLEEERTKNSYYY